MRRFRSCWWGPSVLAAAQLYRVDAGFEKAPRIPFGTRVVSNLGPPQRSAWTPRAVQCAVFGPVANVSGGYLAYEGGRLREIRNFQPEGLTRDELLIVKGMIEESTEPFAPVPPPPAEGSDARLIRDIAGAPLTLGEASCPGCVKQRKRGPPPGGGLWPNHNLKTNTRRISKGGVCPWVV